MSLSMSHLVRCLSLIAISTGATALLASCATGPQGHPAMGMGSAPETKVRVEEVVRREINNSTSYMGTLKSRHSSVMQSRVAGIVTRIFVTPGMTVKAGAPLVEIDPEKQQAMVTSLVAATASTAADKENSIQTLKSLEALLRSKESNLVFARQQEKRYALLASEGAVAAEAAENYITARKMSEADVQSVKAQIEAQKAAIAKMERMIQQSQANRQEQEVQLKYYTLKAPFAGVVGDIPVKLGEYVNSDTKVTIVTENQPLELYVSVPAEKALRLRLGMPVQLTGSDDKVLGEAQVIFISPNVEDQTQSVLVKALYANKDGLLRSNQTVGSKVVWSKEPGLLVPTYAVAHISGQDFVFTAQNSGKGLVARQKAVDLGEIYNNSYLVKSGLVSGDRIVVSGVQNLTDGAAIAPQTAISGR
jgi:multidrug efflux pump subunit AcrA (membrane-fusion protein)